MSSREHDMIVGYQASAVIGVNSWQKFTWQQPSSIDIPVGGKGPLCTNG